MISFASDNYSGVHPNIMNAIVAANVGHCAAYGDDAWTQEAIAKFKHEFGDEIDVYFVFLGTAANVLGLHAMMQTYEGVISTDVGHINQDEGGAPERFAGKLLTVPHTQGKLTVEQLEVFVKLKGNPHKIQPRVVSITQATEYGTVYTIDELRRISDFAHAHEMWVHMDGARICNAAAALNVSLKEMTQNVGVDVLSFGGTKNGMMYGEAVVFFNAELAKQFCYLRKQGMQLASKMRFIGAQFNALFTDGLWLKNAQHSNKMALLLAQKLNGVTGVELTQPVTINAVFVKLPAHVIEPLRRTFSFYVWQPDCNEIRLMTSFDTQPEHVEQFIAELQRYL